MPSSPQNAAAININRLDFGALAAERDILQGLKDYFYESESYRNFSNGNKSVLLGNRGSGKSAIFKILSEHYKKERAFVIELAPENYSYEILSETMAKEAEGSWAKQGAYAAAWKYLIYVVAMKRLSTDRPNLLEGKGRPIKKYLRDNFYGAQSTPIDAFISYLKRLEGVKIGPYEASVKARELRRLYKLEEINELLPVLNEVCAKNSIVIFVDELDRGWDASEDAQAFVSGLFQAALSINQTTPNFKVLVSLRKELYDNIPALYEDAQKVWDLIEVIEWDEPSLFDMITRRIRHSLKEMGGRKSGEWSEDKVPSDEVWSAVFAETLEYRKTKSFNYMIDRSLYRPRELIQFCNIAKEKAKQAGALPIDYQIISEAEFSYSENRTKDIAAEYKFQYPGLLSVFEAFRGRVYTFEREDLEFLALQITLGDIPTSAEASWVKDQDAEFMIDALWQVGFLRAQAVGGVKARRRSGSTYLGPHQISNLHLRNLSRFHVHPMFRDYLGMKEASKRDSA
jgi:energy-coupling factor transporter ATP-binding protein EcfA2